jgi:hypothetical protein
MTKPLSCCLQCLFPLILTTTRALVVTGLEGLCKLGGAETLDTLDSDHAPLGNDSISPDSDSGTP